jgi:hypothetical protein
MHDLFGTERIGRSAEPGMRVIEEKMSAKFMDAMCRRRSWTMSTLNASTAIWSGANPYWWRTSRSTGSHAAEGQYAAVAR